MDTISALRERARANRSEGYRHLLFSDASSARPHFARAAEALKELSLLYEEDLRPIDEQARADLEIARMYWRAGDKRTLLQFNKALESYLLGENLATSQERLRAAYGRAYIYLFLEEFEKARRDAKLAYQLERINLKNLPVVFAMLYGTLSFRVLRKKFEGMAENVDAISSFIRGNQHTLPQRELLQLLDLRDFFKNHLVQPQ